MRKKKAYIIIITKKGEVKIEKGQFIHPLIIKTKSRIVVKTTEPLIHKGKECYFVYELDPHTYNIQDGSIISKEIFETAKKFAEETQSELYLSTEPNLPEDLSPHLATEKILGLLINESLIKNFLKSFISLERETLIKYIFYIIIGFIIGFLTGQIYAPNGG